MEGTLSLFDWRPPEVAASNEPRVVIFDCETTGIDYLKDQIIELCVQHGLGAEARSRTWRIRPSVAIHPAAQNVHGISIEELAGCPQFAAYADEIIRVFVDADVLIGYNISFDIEMLQSELARLERPPLDLSNKKIVDAFRLWQQCEPRSLQHAHRRFVGDEFAAAHSARADVAATGRVLMGMLEQFKLDLDWQQIASVSDPLPNRASWVGPSKHLRWEGEAIVVGFGKHTGIALHVLAEGPDRSFVEWIVSASFPPHVIEIAQNALSRAAEDLARWARERFGQSAPTAQPPFSK